MSPHRALPQELVDQVIDELCDAYRDADHDKRSDHRLDAYKALHACALISKNWTSRSRAHLFREVKIRGDEEGLFAIPPDSIMPYIEKLKIQLESQHYRLFPSKRLLTPFHTAPITYLGITGGVLTTKARVCLVECAIALSATLQTMAFKSCSLSLHLVLDIVLAHPGLKRLHLICCSIGITIVIPRPGTRSEASGMELGVFSHSAPKDHHLTMAAAALLPSRFGRLDLDHIYSPGTSRATSALIKANAESLSSLQVHIISPKSPGLMDQPPFSLGGCSNLSELSLDMENTESCIVTTSTAILLTLDPIQCSRLGWIRLTTGCVYRWLCEKSRTELTRAWGSLDTVLSDLAQAASTGRRRKLTFVLVSTGEHKEGCISFGKKWLPELLPLFRRLGTLRLDCGPSRPNPALSGARSRPHGPNCMKED